MVWKLKQQKDLKGRLVLTNFHTTFSDAEIDSGDLRDSAENEDFHDLDIGADEVQNFLEGRRTGKTKQIKLTYVILQLRKKRVNWHYTAQSLDNVERRLVAQTDFIILCENLGCNNKECKDQSCGIITCGVYHYEVFDGHTGQFLDEFWLNGPKDFYNFYDTDEIVLDFASLQDDET